MRLAKQNDRNTSQDGSHRTYDGRSYFWACCRNCCNKDNDKLPCPVAERSNHHQGQDHSECFFQFGTQFFLRSNAN